MHSLQSRLSTGIIIALALLVVVLLAVGSYSLRHLAEDFVGERLEHDIDALLATMFFNGRDQLRLRPGRLSPIFRQPYSGHYYKIQAGGVTLRSRSLWDADLSIPPTTRNRITRRFIRGPQDQQLLMLARTFRLQGQNVVIAVTEDFTGLAAGLRRLTVNLSLLALVLLSVLILAQRWLVHQGLKPLEKIRRDILRLTHGEIHRLNADTPSEVRPLVEQINHLIGVMEKRLQRSRHALGNLAHALKAPLTILTQLVEQPEVKAQGEVGAELALQTRQIHSLLNRELKRARIAGAATPGQRVVLTDEVADLVDTLKKIYRDKPLDLQCRIPPNSLFPGERNDLLELLGNLLDNACQWAARSVRLTVKETDKWQQLSVEDDGPGAPPEQLELLTRRGVRVDESRSGHGLGLAIVTDIAEQYDGRLRLGRSQDLGGFLAEVELPAI